MDGLYALGKRNIAYDFFLAKINHPCPTWSFLFVQIITPSDRALIQFAVYFRWLLGIKKLLRGGSHFYYKYLLIESQQVNKILYDN